MAERKEREKADASTLQQAKKRARQVCRRYIETVSTAQWAAWGADMAAQLLDTSLWHEAQRVFCFVSLTKEPDTRTILRAALDQGKVLCVPRILGGGEMEAVQLNSLDELSPGTFGILEPTGRKALRPDQIDLAVLPCLAVAPNGARLGRGGGYYDRFLADFSGISVVLCAQGLLCSSTRLPAGALDARARFVLTEQCMMQVPAGEAGTTL